MRIQVSPGDKHEVLRLRFRMDRRSRRRGRREPKRLDSLAMQTKEDWRGDHPKCEILVWEKEAVWQRGCYGYILFAYRQRLVA